MKQMLFLVITISLFAQQEFRVNTTTDSTQRQPAISVDGNGNYAVVWKSEAGATFTGKSDVYIQFFTVADQKTGSEQRVNTILPGEQEKPVIAMNTGGTAVVVWTSYTSPANSYDIYGRLFVNNLPAGDEFLVNTVIANTQSNPSVAFNNAGTEFTVAWDSWYQDGGDRGIYAQRFQISGNAASKTGTEFLVNSNTAYSQARPAVKYLADGKILFIWESFKTASSSPAGYDIYGRIFSADGSIAGNEFTVNTYSADYQWLGDCTVLDDDSFTVVWCSWEQDGDDGGIYYQRFNADGTKRGGEFRINKSTAYYQWLPKIRKITGQKFAVIWSSWKQDGNREGVYTTFIDEQENRFTLETQVNVTTESFQWEPDFKVSSTGEVLAVWSSFSNTSGYDIIARRFTPPQPEGVVNPTGYLHTSGTTTGSFLVQAVSSAQMNGHTYEVSFDTTVNKDSLYATIKDLNTSQTKLQNFPLNRGANIIYTTPVFDGIAVEFNPVYRLSLDVLGSYFRNNSGSTVSFTAGLPAAGSRLLAPIDVAVVWGSSDTLANGNYASPLDTAMGLNGVREIVTPFYAINLMTGNRLTLLVREPNATKNKKWNLGEEIIFITPPPYQVTAFNTHAQISSAAPAGTIILPNAGDTVYILTKRPVTPADKFTFVASPASVVAGGVANPYIPVSPLLSQNYPNPFNPETTISYTLPKAGKAVLTVYSVLGEQIAVLINEVKDAGTYKINFSARNLASGVYIYSLRFENTVLANKMIFLR
ncbi:MAG: T9SS type A sorting domain-containing protein [Ignavibacteriaceae bacterium]|nr:T9SS type A sorting domain-containing protein [Ignavibacteriaceae bacterium]